ncbi:MAG: phospholipid carrier-dependent glycosyltransferase, partial [Agromyces sp.]|nr:phospholipid carrier-dependent glycosyltransferase [Agromyces sp.]
MLSTPRRRTLWYWGGPILVTLLAAVLRFWNLGHPQAIVFDETYYVKDAWTLLHNGYESAWPENADADFARGDTDIFTDDPAYVVHPPLGKWMIALGMAVFGADSAFWWRASTALAGTVAVFVLAMVARRLWPSTIVAVIAAFLLAIDGNAIVMSRVALLDNWIMLFVLLGFWFVLLDREHAARELARRLAEARAQGRDPHYGPALWARPWVVAAGVAFGAACSVKWSGAWFLAAFGLYLVVVDALAR